MGSRYYCVQACDRFKGWVTLEPLNATKLHEVIALMELVSSLRPRWALRTHKMPHGFNPPESQDSHPSPEELVEAVVSQPPFTTLAPTVRAPPSTEIPPTLPLPNYRELQDGLREFLSEALDYEHHRYYVEGNILYCEYMRGIPKGQKCAAKHTYLSNIEDFMRQAGYESHDKGVSYYPR